MSVLFNGIFASREMGVLTPLLLLDRVELSDMVVNEIKLDRGDIEYIVGTDGSEEQNPILPTPDNFKDKPELKWSINTELHGSFNMTLEAGPLMFEGKDIDSIVIRRTSNRTNFMRWEDVVVIDNIMDMIEEGESFSYSDKAVESGVHYKYAIQP